jgi:hypothetical protein
LAQLSNIAQDSSENYPGPPIITFEKLDALIIKFTQWCLCHDLSLTATKSEPIFKQLVNVVSMHTYDANILWAPLTSLQMVNSNYADCPFIILTMGRLVRT